MNYWENKDINDMPDEEWRQIPGFSSHYRISNKGRIKATELSVHYKGIYPYVRPEKIMYVSFSAIRPYKTDRYLMTVLKTDTWVNKTTYVHRLVALAFVENPFNKPHVNHKDGNTLNNNPSNLEWCTNKENIQHAHDNGLVNTAKGEKAPKAKLKNIEAIEIFNDISPQPILAEKYNVDPSTISGIKTGRYWGSVTGKRFVPTSRTKIKV